MSRTCRAITSGFVLLLTVTLSACDPAVSPPDWQARIVQDKLQIQFCEPVSAEELSIDINQEGQSERWREYWNAKGALDLPAGTVVTIEDHLEGSLTQIDSDVVVDSDTKILVFAYEDGDQVERAAYIFGADAAADSWFDPIESGWDYAATSTPSAGCNAEETANPPRGG